jgi:hypothetical protein
MWWRRLRRTGFRRLAAAIFAGVVALVGGSAPASALPRSATITTAGLGAIKIGMSERQVERAAKRPITRREGAGTGGCTTAKLGDKLFGLFAGPRLARIYVGSRRYATRSGVRVGDSEQKVIAIYAGQIVRERHAYRPGGSYLKVVDGNRKVVFDTDGRRVTQISTGRAPEIDYVEGCA